MNTPHDEQQRSETSGRRGNGRQPPREPIAITDRRRIDPVTGQVREDTGPTRSSHSGQGGHPITTTSGKAPPGEKMGAPPPVRGPGGARPESRQVDAGRAAELTEKVAELTADLQRLQAEYANYRRRVKRDRAAATENAKATVAAQFLGVLDDLDWAREHGDTAREPLHSLYRKIRTILARMGVAAFGEGGDQFDPTLHEAASHEGHGTDLVVDTVLRRGYTVGVNKVLRTALVTVIDRDRYEKTDDAGDPPGSEQAPGAGAPDAHAPNTSPNPGAADPVPPADPHPPADPDARSGAWDRGAGPENQGLDPNPYRCG
ncbi:MULTISPECIES: nucleotide exchange factor GrpE [unclassified Rhodococcus (in: high G+C Gram-positive bacteria)]|uniref:nucleotide exchange factor GrpE n=1 Tax=unclassified Rhodococcus (in: high G+C Gram-positive bacteria) TaxID=192944 RepID=UPI0002A417F9|nr:MULTISPECIES: nucleotide exchange factor GrpE [unclassified Rhodococcus (in: high G+C Gram-positive bacteria)]ELB93971.1 heat shock protein GrpE [Rhodococcus wratislaviensis IFP 2016]MBC2637405.1 nucleotide exchange factor GrpE [Rhodococcus sp. 3A]MBC2898137.1 nucleotide exchange factor GrpE [Rhodococcus sp. 4CII]